MDFLSIFVVILLIVVLLKQVSYLVKLKIKTKKRTGEKLAIVVSIIVLFWLTHIFAENGMHYVAVFVAILFVIANWMKQGITDEGVLLVARGKELYRWNEMKEVKMTLDDLLKVELYNKRGARVASQTYKKEDFDRVKAFFKEKNIVAELVNQE